VISIPTTSINLRPVPTGDSAIYVWQWSVSDGSKEVAAGRELHLQHAMDAARHSAIFRTTEI
jgi:hypothetical protein